MATGSNKTGTRLQVLYDYEYTTDNGANITIKEGEECLLLKRSNDNWWSVVRDGEKKPIYVPASYVKVIYKTVVNIGDSVEIEQPNLENASFDHGSSFDHDKLEAPTNVVPSPSPRHSPSPTTTAEVVSKVHQSSSTNNLDESQKDITNETDDKPKSMSDSVVGENNLFINTTANKRHTFQKQDEVDSGHGQTTDFTVKSTLSVPPKNIQNNNQNSGEVDYVNLDDFRKSIGLPQVQQSSDDGGDYANLEIIQEAIRNKNKQEADHEPLHDKHDKTEPPKHVETNHKNENQKEETLSSSTEAVAETTGKSKPLSVIDDTWEVHKDATSGKQYYYNIHTNETLWELPQSPTVSVTEVENEKKEVTTDDAEVTSPMTVSDSAFIPEGWTEEKNEKGEIFYINDVTKEKWFSSVDETGRVYYYRENTGASAWALPESPKSIIEALKKDEIPPPNNEKKQEIFTYQVTDLRGILHKTKITEGGRKLRKNWEKCYAVINENNLYFYKDQKAATPKTNSPLGKPESPCIDLTGSTIITGSKEKTSRKNILQLTTASGLEYLLQIDDPVRLHEWYVTLSYAAKQKGTYEPTDIDKKEHSQLDGTASPKRSASRKLNKSATVDEVSELTEEKKKKIRERLRKFLKRRPTPESLHDKGIIKENVFGAHLHVICERKKKKVPTATLR